MDSDNNQVKELVEEKETNRKAPAMQLSLADLKSKTNAELFEIAQSLGISGYSRKRKNDLVFEILRKSAESKGYLFSEGILEITPEGYGFCVLLMISAPVIATFTFLLHKLNALC